MSNHTTQTAEQQIGEHLTGRVQDFRDFATLYDEGYERTGEALAAAERLEIDTDDSVDLYDAALERTYEYPLGVSTYRVHRIDLSTGGPGDWLEVMVDSDGAISRISYHFAPWFDHASRDLAGSEFDAAERFVTTLISEL